MVNNKFEFWGRQWEFFLYMVLNTSLTMHTQFEARVQFEKCVWHQNKCEVMCYDITNDISTASDAIPF